MSTNLKLLTMLLVVTLAGLVPEEASAQTTVKEPPSEARPVEGEQKTVLDPIEQSRKVRANLEMWPERVRHRLAEAEQRLKGLDFQEIKTQKLFAQDFHEILTDLDQEAAAIQEAFSSVTTDLELYREAVAQAPASFRSVATAFEQKALENQDPSLKGHYADFSSTSRNLAQRYEDKHKSLVSLEKELKEKLIFVTKSREFIADVKDFVSTIPATEEGLEVEAFVKRLNAYINVFQDSIKMLKGLSDQVGKESAPPNIPSPGTSSPKTTAPVTRDLKAGSKTTPQQTRRIPLSDPEYSTELAKFYRAE